ncbi:MAG: flavodoxin family protein [Thermoguttaceae bacterium]|nr:flavodoxin family protein [Thermoguttaceae bacterium]
MNVLILNGSPRREGNTEIIARTFAQTAQKNGHSVNVVNVQEVKVAPCMACNYCLNVQKGVCVQKDGMETIRPLFDAADVIVFASPIYFFTISGQMKCVIDRFYAANKVGIGSKKCFVLLDSHSPNVFDGAVAMFEAMCRYLKWDLAGVLKLDGMTAKGCVAEDPRLEDVKRLAGTI